jgi:hypothetical protein
VLWLSDREKRRDLAPKKGGCFSGSQLGIKGIIRAQKPLITWEFAALGAEGALNMLRGAALGTEMVGEAMGEPEQLELDVNVVFGAVWHGEFPSCELR